MRYIPNTAGGDTDRKFNAGRRPDLSMIPKVLKDKMLERERIMNQRSAAQTLVNDLASDTVTREARNADDLTASTAARAGKPVPAPEALPKLEADRTAAEHALAAQKAAYAAVTAECDEIAIRLFEDGAEAAAKMTAQTRASIIAKATELADAIDAAVAEAAIRDWLQTGVYIKDARTWPTEFVDLQRHGLTRLNTSPVNVRGVIVAAATSVLAEVEGL